MGVTNRNRIREHLNYLHDISRLSWRKIAQENKYRGIPARTLHRMATTNYVPDKWRQKLGLPGVSKVEMINGRIPVGSQSLGARQCVCGMWFISNHPRRKHCFMCSPYRGKQRVD